MRSINKSRKIIICVLAAALLSACGEKEVELPYGSLASNAAFSMDAALSRGKMDLFAEKLCAAVSDVTEKSSISTGSVRAACVYDIDGLSVLYSYNAESELAPASLTKIMTALLVLENCPDLDEKVTVGDVTIREQGAQLFHLKEGDHITIRDLLYATMIYSANDAALALAIHVGGSEQDFCRMMNERAKLLGATHTNFVNSNGLSSDEHYTCAYDLYLMFQAAVQYEEFRQIIQTPSVSITYTTAEGAVNTREISTTNQYLKGTPQPAALSIVGGKTGSTSAAGKCIILYAVSPQGHPYIVVVMGAEDTDSLYRITTQLCNDTVR